MNNFPHSINIDKFNIIRDKSDISYPLIPSYYIHNKKDDIPNSILEDDSIIMLSDDDLLKNKDLVGVTMIGVIMRNKDISSELRGKGKKLVLIYKATDDIKIFPSPIRNRLTDLILI